VVLVREHIIPTRRRADRVLVIEGQGQRRRARISVRRSYIEDYARLKAAILERVPRGCRIDVQPG
jgi:hypothetical protein